MANSASAMAEDTAVTGNAADAAAAEVRAPGSLPGAAVATPTTPEAKRGKAGVEPLSAFNAVHQRQDQVDDSLAKLRTELNAEKNVQAQVIKEGVGSDVVANLQAEVRELREEVKANGCGKLAADMVECLKVIEANDLAQKTSLQLFERMVLEEKEKLAKLALELQLYKATAGPSPSTDAATFGPPPGVDVPVDGMTSMNAFMPYVKLVQDELKVAVSQLKAADEAQEQDILKLTSGASDGIGQMAASAAHVAQHISWVTAALATAEDQLVALAASATIASACPCSSGNCPCKCSADPWAKADPWKKHKTGSEVQTDHGAGLNSGKRTYFMLTPESSNEGGDDGDDDHGDDDDDEDHSSPDSDFEDRRPHHGGRDDKSKITMYSKPFERKDNKSPYDGKVGGALWKTKTTNFLVTRVPEMVAALEWTEKQESSITPSQLKGFSDSKTWKRALGGDTPTDLKILAHHLWGFLGDNLSGDAYTVFGNIPRSQGFEAWREAMKSLNERSTAELLKLESKVLAPTECSNDGHVLMAIEQWEGALKRYLDAGGEELSVKRRRGGLLRLLPEKLRDRVIWDLGEDKPADVIIEWLQKRLIQSNSCRAKGSRQL
jgi:hypothetical protein